MWHQVLAGVMLSFGGLLSEIVGGGSPGLTESNPGLVKALSGFVFPVGLVMYVGLRLNTPRLISVDCRIVLQGHELVTSNMMVSLHYPRLTSSFIARSDTPYRDPQRSNPVVESSVQLDLRCVRR